MKRLSVKFNNRVIKKPAFGRLSILRVQSEIFVWDLFYERTPIGLIIIRCKHNAVVIGSLG